MSCGDCVKKPAASRGEIHTRAAMCSVCRAGERGTSDFGRRGTVRCSVSGRDIRDHVVHGSPCPLRVHPEPGELVLRWARVEWYGVPMPVRLWLRRRPGAFEGCGCIKPLKDAWVWCRRHLYTAGGRICRSIRRSTTRPA